MMKPFLSRLSRDERGAAVIELALLAPVLAMMVIGVVDMSNSFGRKLELEEAAQRALEMVLQTTGEDTAEAAIVSEVIDEAGVEAEDIDVTRRLECEGVEVADITEECDPGDTEARYISVTIRDSYDPMFPIHFSGINPDGTYHISVAAGMRTQ